MKNRFQQEETGYAKTAISDLQGAWLLLRDQVALENHRRIWMMKAFTRRITILCLVCLFVSPIFWGSEALSETNTVQMEFTFNILLTEKKCQMAIWLVNEQGLFVDTIYATKKVAKKGLGNRGGEIDDKLGGSRLSVLPVWAHQRGIDYGGGNFYPSKDKPLVDSISSDSKSRKVCLALATEEESQAGKIRLLY